MPLQCPSRPLVSDRFILVVKRTPGKWLRRMVDVPIALSERVLMPRNRLSVGTLSDDPNRFLIARSLAPELVGTDDIVELDLDGQPVCDEQRSLYLERFIHAAIFAARPDVIAVVHAHAEDTLPFGIARETKLRPVIHSGSFIGAEVPVWTSPTISATPTCS